MRYLNILLLAVLVFIVHSYIFFDTAYFRAVFITKLSKLYPIIFIDLYNKPQMLTSNVKELNRFYYHIIQVIDPH